MEALPVIRSLVCHAHMPMARRFLASLARFHRDPFTVCLHDDGTLTAEDRELLSASAPEVTIISRAEADAAVCAQLAGHPRCLAFRRTETMALKLFDPTLLSTGAVQYCDCDVLFLRPFTGFSAALAGAHPPLVFMRDLFNTYSVGWRRLLSRATVPLADRLNAGIMLLEPAVFDLDFVEWFLGRPEAHDVPGFAEQTAWSALVQRDGGSLLDARAVTFAPFDGVLPPPERRAVAWHFVGPLRRRFEATAAALERDTAADVLPAVTPGTFRPATLNFPRYCVSRWRKERLARALARPVQEAVA
jgi:hypothetical protein